MAWDRWTAVIAGADNPDGTSGKILATWGIIAPTRKFLREGEDIKREGGYERDAGLQRYGLQLRSYPFTFESGDHSTEKVEEVMAVVRKRYKRLVSIDGPVRSHPLGNFWEVLFSVYGDAEGLPVSVRDYDIEEDGEGRESLDITLALLTRL